MECKICWKDFIGNAHNQLICLDDKCFKENKKQYDKQRRFLKNKELKEYDKFRHNRDWYWWNYYKVLERDNYECGLCKSIEQLIVHHIDWTWTYSFKKNKNINNNMNNLQTLCRSCHLKQHPEVIYHLKLWPYARNNKINK